MADIMVLIYPDGTWAFKSWLKQPGTVVMWLRPQAHITSQTSCLSSVYPHKRCQRQQIEYSETALQISVKKAALKGQRFGLRGCGTAHKRVPLCDLSEL